MHTPENDGFTLIELLIVVAIIGIIAAIAVPGLMRARQAANEASAMGSIRAINSAQALFASSCGGGGFAQSLGDLGTAPAGGVPYISVDLVAGVKSGYTITLEDGPGAADVLVAAKTCNGSAASSRTGFFVHAEPVSVGVTGQRSFASSNVGTLYFKSDGTAIANDMSDGLVLR